MRVLIIRPGALGDTLMLLPGLYELHGKVHATCVGRQPGLDFIRPYVDHALDIESFGWHRLFLEQPDGGALPVRDVDTAVAFFNDSDHAIERNLKAYLPRAAVHMFRSFPDPGHDIHTAEYLCRCLESAGLPVEPVQSMASTQNGGHCLKWNGPETSAVRRDTIVLHPGSGSREKNHPPEFWVELIGHLQRAPSFKNVACVFLLGPAEMHLHDWFLEKLTPRDADIRLSLDSGTLKRTLDRAKLCVGHDSGITHLAALAGIPTMALFKKSSVTQWRPLGPFVDVIVNDNPDSALLDAVIDASRRLILEFSGVVHQ